MKRLMQSLALVAVVVLSTGSVAEARLEICAYGTGVDGPCHLHCAGQGQWGADMTAEECCAYFEACCNSEGTAYFGDPGTGFYCQSSSD